MVFCGIYPADGADYADLRDALEKLQLNDASLSFEPETSVALGFGFRCGFLGLLHMEIIQERLEREFDLDLDHHRAQRRLPRGQARRRRSSTSTTPRTCPDPAEIELAWRSPLSTAQIFTPSEYVGTIMELCQDEARRVTWT